MVRNIILFQTQGMLSMRTMPLRELSPKWSRFSRAMGLPDNTEMVPVCNYNHKFIK